MVLSFQRRKREGGVMAGGPAGRPRGSSTPPTCSLLFAAGRAAPPDARAQTHGRGDAVEYGAFAWLGS